ncbi:MAG: tRNA (adenosine(37)-N6)-threonylcarbamoyltransferase complex ATPase subunit type 1 TsaE [Omnitrophica bacterium RIFCSPLOWO2_12_FULL_50_11]|nr:MAG: tRNA (adenosine(37)-N6)-threonylcarbamoyltransferase complex ATPase subunit type 1 TsaE [Omnitrophica bacterium RIFCSPLOWO2_12_FULL_50_11]
MTKAVKESRFDVQKWKSRSVDETLRWGTSIARNLKPGTCLALVGPLGSGKTVFVKGIGRGLGIADRSEIRSPSFVLFHRYTGPVSLHHFDFYRLDAESDLERIGIYEFLFNSNAVSVIEWADRIPEVLQRAHLRIDLSITGETSRTIRAQSNER